MNEHSRLKSILDNLITRKSVTPDDAGCQSYILSELSSLGFKKFDYSYRCVTNSLICNQASGPMLLFVGHTDVVPPGPSSHWQTDPFELTDRDGAYTGRGTSDMKGSIAAFIVALQNSALKGKHIGLLVTSDEEGPAQDGVKHAIAKIIKEKRHIGLAIVGEPTASEVSGDTIKIGRRGSLNGTLTITGSQGHVAYPQLANNPIHKVPEVLKQICAIRFEDENKYFDSSQLQVTSIYSGSPGIRNVIPGSSMAEFNIRFSPKQTVDTLKKLVGDIIKNKPYANLTWENQNNPYLTTDEEKISFVSNSVEKTVRKKPKWSTSGGTSDGRYIAPYQIPVIELGPPNRTIHKVNEMIYKSDLEIIYRCYKQIIEDYPTS